MLRQQFTHKFGVIIDLSTSIFEIRLARFSLTVSHGELATSASNREMAVYDSSVQARGDHRTFAGQGQEISHPCPALSTDVAPISGALPRGLPSTFILIRNS